MNSSCLTKTETKSPFLIGVAGGTACGKVNIINNYCTIIFIYFEINRKQKYILVYCLQKYNRKIGPN